MERENPPSFFLAASSAFGVGIMETVMDSSIVEERLKTI